jgi:RimJ/RimL family protein N-acetyltransferase
MNESCIFPAPVYCAIEQHDELPIGFIEASPHNGDVYVNIGIVPQHRNQGVAQKLFRGLLDWFVDSQYQSILWNTHKSNAASIKLAQKLGMQEFSPPKHKKNAHMRFFALGKCA